MSVTVTQAIANTREFMDAAQSARWSDPIITTVLGIVSDREWSGLLGANPYFRFAQRSVTTDANGQFLYTALDSGSADSKQTHYRILAISDGTSIYQQSTFMDMPLASTANYVSTYQRAWYDAGSYVQVIPVQSGTTMTVTCNWTPPRVDQLSAASVTIDFPDGHEVILWLEAAAQLLSKGGAENDAGQTMRAMADQERSQMYGDLQRRAAVPNYLQFPDRSSDWMG